MTRKELAEKVALLKDGQIVEIDGLRFSAKKVKEYWSQTPCNYCNIDCLCRGDVAEVCEELDWMNKSTWYLNLES
jgi:hypothetical protein